MSATVRATATTDNDDGLTQFAESYNLPASIVAGELLVLFVKHQHTAYSLQTPSGWTKSFASTDTYERTTVWTKIAAGDEGAEVTFQWTGATNFRSVGIALAIADWHGTIATGLEISSFVTDSANPPSLSESWPEDSILWLAYAGFSTSDGTITAPTNYTTNLVQIQNTISNATSRQTIGVSWRSTTGVSSEDPGLFTYDGTGGGFVEGLTLAVRPLDNGNLGLTITGIKEPNEADTLVASVTTARVKVWYGSDDTGAEDELYDNQTITNGSLTVDLSGGTVDAAAIVEVMWTVGTERKLFITDTTVVDLGSGS